jgi:hypothetical protein
MEAAMEFTGSGLRAWYATHDAPAPLGDVPGCVPVCATVGVEPSHSSNRVDVLYRQRGGPGSLVHGTLVRTQTAGEKQYFKVTFPLFASGDTVDYQPVFRCGGRCITTPQPFPSSFRVVEREPPERPQVDPWISPLGAGAHRYRFSMEHLTRVDLQLSAKPEVIGNTPDGLRVDFFVTSGFAKGEKLKGLFQPHGGDWMRIRTDGVGVTDIFATIETDDGALILMESSGMADFGADGYKNALAGHFPNAAEVVVAPRFLSEDPRYAWLNRLQCLGIGYANLRDLHVYYDFYGIRSKSKTTEE